jgi:hypothetical protein
MQAADIAERIDGQKRQLIAYCRSLKFSIAGLRELIREIDGEKLVTDLLTQGERGKVR